MPVIAVINQKGGVGKTTSVVNLGAGLARLDKRVLVVDLDPQAHLTYSLGVQAHELDLTIYNVLKGEASLEETFVERDGLHLVPSSLDLSGAEMEFAMEAGREFLLRESLAGIKEYDFVFLDCPPSLGLLSLNALTSAHEVYIALQSEFLALQGLSRLLETIEKTRQRLNHQLEITGIIATRHDGRKVLNQEVAEKIREHFGEKVFSTFIRDNISLAEAPSFGRSIFEYRPGSRGAEDYMSLCREILQRRAA
ncbi:MAG: ParA family protein [Thermodesulfovibrionales bacterium]|nr:ParA family protein [Thermodesulfovibrionales bacterium]